MVRGERLAVSSRQLREQLLTALANGEARTAFVFDRAGRLRDTDGPLVGVAEPHAALSGLEALAASGLVQLDFFQHENGRRRAAVARITERGLGHLARLRERVH